MLRDEWERRREEKRREEKRREEKARKKREKSRDKDKEKEREIYAEVRAVPPLVVRADGRGFKRVLGDSGKFAKPYDERFARGMAKAAEMFFKKSGFDPVLAYTFSDEISFFFEQVPFRGRVEKLDSVVAGFLASALTIVFGFEEPVAFDARVIPVCACGGEREEGGAVLEYLTQRQAEAWRNHLNAYAYYGLVRSKGLGGEEAEKRLRGMKAGEIHEMLFRDCGINLNETPKWQRRGILVVKQRYEKDYKIVQHWNLPLFGKVFSKKFSFLKKSFSGPEGIRTLDRPVSHKKIG